MRERESAYWDGVARDTCEKPGEIKDNWLKRHFLAQFLLKCHWAEQKVLEIGVGNGVTAALLSLSCGRNWDYIGTDVSEVFCRSAKHFNLNVVQADVLSLPEGQFTRILCLDSLEHVRPEDRDEGYRNIAARLEKGGLLLINMPINRSLHDDEFDHGIDLTDLIKLEGYGLALRKYERYEIQYATCRRAYGFVVMSK